MLLTLVCSAWFVGSAPLLALDLDGLIRLGKREEAVRDVKRAAENVESASSEVTATRKHLDAFLSRHFEHTRGHQPPPPVKPDAAAVGIELRPSPQLERLKAQLDDLLARREELLGHLTEEHPEVLGVAQRMATVKGRISSLADASREAEQQARLEQAEAERRWTDYVDHLDLQGEKDAGEYEQLYDDWRSAESALETALAAESAAEKRLEAMTPKVAATGAQPADGEPRDATGGKPQDGTELATPQSATAGQPRNAPATAASDPPSASASGSSQPLALAALMIALAVAALAAVRLARSTADPIFASVDEVAAALAIPVVGIIPAAATRFRRAGATDRPRRSWILLGQIVLAVLVFAAVAYAVQNPGGLWRLCTDPREALSSIGRAIGGRN